MSKKLTYKQVKEHIEQFGYKLLSETYERGSDKLLLSCPRNHIFEMTFNKFQQGRRCKECNILDRRVNIDLIEECVKEAGYTLIDGDCRTTHDNIEVMCSKGHTYKVSYGSFKDGRRCKRCAGLQRLTLEHVSDYISSFGYELLSNRYKNNRTKMSIRCPEGHIYEMSYHDFTGGHRCPVCTNCKKLTIDYVRDFMLDKKYELISNTYVRNSGKLTIKCPSGHTFKMSFASFQQGRRCPECKFSYGEKRIIEVLDESGIEYVCQYRIPNCKDKDSLPFDFYIPAKELLIEYDGIQHFEPREAFGGIEAFKAGQRKDAIKNEYCKQHNINLLRIPYWEYRSIEQILKNQLNLHID